MQQSDTSLPEKREHPRKNANWLSFITFWYTIPIFRMGYKRDFDESDLTKALDAHKSSLLGEKLAVLWNREVQRAKEHNDVPNLTKVLLRMFLRDILLQGLALLIMEVPVRLCQPMFLGLLLRYFNPENHPNTEA